MFNNRSIFAAMFGSKSTVTTNAGVKLCPLHDPSSQEQQLLREMDSIIESFNKAFSKDERKIAVGKLFLFLIRHDPDHIDNKIEFAVKVIRGFTLWLEKCNGKMEKCFHRILYNNMSYREMAIVAGAGAVALPQRQETYYILPLMLDLWANPSICSTINSVCRTSFPRDECLMSFIRSIITKTTLYTSTKDRECFFQKMGGALLSGFPAADADIISTVEQYIDSLQANLNSPQSRVELKPSSFSNN